MTTSKFRTMRQELLADPTFRAEVAREKALMAQIDLAAARQASGMTQEAVAAGMGKSQENVSRKPLGVPRAQRLDVGPDVLAR